MRGAIRLKEIIIRLGAGTIQDGFNNITIELKSATTTQWEDRSSLLPNPELQQLLNRWQLLYPATIQLLSSDINLSPVFDTDTVTNVSSQDLVELNYNFRTAINNWLNFSDFGRVERRLRTNLDIFDRILVIIVSDRLQIWQLPWHFWDLFTDYPQAIEAFAKPRFTDVRHIKPQSNGRANILTLSGRDSRLNLTPDFLKTLPQARPEFVQANSAREIADKLHESNWDLLIFNGHGDTIRYRAFQDGIIYLDNDTPVEISRLKLEIKTAVDRGLQIAIFNCCNGLGLAEQLSDLNIPYIIVMREIVPHECAQNFLQQLLERYSHGESFPEAFKQARQSLRLSPGSFAQFADWLPILFHNPLSNDVTWQDLSATVFSSLIPPQLMAICRYISHPQRQIWTTVGISLALSLLALTLQSQPQLIAWQNTIEDRLQAARFDRIAVAPSQVTIVDYRAFSPLGQLSNDRELQEAIAKVEQTTKPIAWIVNFEINSAIFDRRNVIQGCIDKSLDNTQARHFFQLQACDLDPIDTAIDKYKLPKLDTRNLRLNWQFLGEINSVKMDIIANLSKDEVQKLFQNKLVLVGDFNKAELNSVTREAIAIDRVIRANDPQYPLPLLINRSTSEQFSWIFLWSILTGIIMWRSRWWLIFVAVVIGEIAIAGILSILGYGLSLIITPIAICCIGGVVGFLKKISTARFDRDR